MRSAVYVDPAYELRKPIRAEIAGVLEPAGFRLGHVWGLLGGWSLIWYWGKELTGFAHGKTPQEAADSAMRQVFGEL